VKSVLLVLGFLTAQAAVDPARLDQIRQLSPERKAELKRRLEALKQLPAEERERLKDNLRKLKAMPAEEARKVRERAQKLSPAEQQQFADLASGFFRWSQRTGVREGFPRGLFFQWLKTERAPRMEAIRKMEAGPGSPRIDEFIRLSHEFREAAIVRTLEHVRRHRCTDEPAAAALRDVAPREFWTRWQELTRECNSRRALPGPVAPRPLETPGK
jgi:hypothetical protein